MSGEVFSNVQHPPKEVFGEPISSTRRIVSLDILRGVAVLGILLMNIQAYSIVGSAYQNPYVWGDLGALNISVWILGYIFASGKFIAIFSMLFGAGIVLITRKIEEMNRSAAGVHFTRNFWLMVFGCLHGYLFWYGDILFTYGLCSIPVYFLRKISPLKLLITGVIILLIGSSISLMAGFSIDSWPEENVVRARDNWDPPAEKIEEEIAYAKGSWSDHVVYRMPTVFSMQTFAILFFTGWLVTGYMMVGMALFKWGILSCQRSVGFYKRGFFISFPISLGIILWGTIRNFEEGFSFEYSMFIGSQYNYLGALLMAFSYTCLIMLLCKSHKFCRVKGILSKIGRMAFTNYIFQTLICTTIFYGGLGFGLFSKFQRWEQLLIVFGVWVLLGGFTLFWLKRFRFGPLEWFWRRLTYLKSSFKNINT